MFYLITGSSQGIGYQIAKDLYKQKKKLILCSRKTNKIKKEFIKNCFCLNSDFQKINDIKNIKKFIQKKKIKLSAIISCHGLLGEPIDIFDINKKNWWNIFHTNFTSNLNIIDQLFPFIKKKKYSNIIFFSGGGVFTTWPKFSAYSISKTALVKYSENLSEELYKNKIIINCIAPGFINTNIHKKNYKLLKKLNLKYKQELKKNKNSKPNFKNVVELLNFILKNKNMKLSGKTISANFDKWRTDINFIKNTQKLNNSLMITRSNIN
jgi:3-oxoacyl-[acyl-carrier protein] reductase